MNARISFAIALVLATGAFAQVSGISDIKRLWTKPVKSPADYQNIVVECRKVESMPGISDNDRAWAMFYRAMSLWGANDLTSTETTLKQITNAYPGNSTVCAASYRGLAVIYNTTGRPELSQLCFYIVASFYPTESPYVLYSLRKLNEKEIEPKEMKRVLLKILEVTPDVPENRTLIDLVKNRILAYP